MNDQTRVLPLKDAYRFGIEHGLEREIAEVRDMEIEWDLSYTSSLRRGFVVDLFAKHELLEPFKEQFWSAGNTDWGQRKADFWLRLKDRYSNFLEGRDESTSEPDDEAEEQSFAAEADLRDFLAKNLERVEPGLCLHRQGERSGVEFPVANGRIDILAVDRAGRFLVFELKLARGRDRALGQLLYYMSWVDTHLGNGPCRGVIIAKEITDELTLAVKRVQGVLLYRYKLSVTVEQVE